jgi:hypothetical protein
MTNKSSAIDILCMGIFSLVRFRHPYLGEYSRFVNLSFHISRIIVFTKLPPPQPLPQIGRDSW